MREVSIFVSSRVFRDNFLSVCGFRLLFFDYVRFECFKLSHVWCMGTRDLYRIDISVWIVGCKRINVYNRVFAKIVCN